MSEKHSNPRSTFRKLAREAVIFGLLALALGVAGGFWIGFNAPSKMIVDYDALARQAGEIDPSTGKPLPPLYVDCYDSQGNLLHKSLPFGYRMIQCGQNEISRPHVDPPIPHVQIYAMDTALVSLCAEGKAPFNHEASPALCPQAPQYSSILKNPADYRRELRSAIVEALLDGLLTGVFGFPCGLCLWIFYRLIYFAVKG